MWDMNNIDSTIVSLSSCPVAVPVDAVVVVAVAVGTVVVDAVDTLWLGLVGTRVGGLGQVLAHLGVL